MALRKHNYSPIASQIVFVCTPITCVILSYFLKISPYLSIIPTAFFQQLYTYHNIPSLLLSTSEVNPARWLFPHLAQVTRLVAYVVIGVVAPGVCGWLGGASDEGEGVSAA